MEQIQSLPTNLKSHLGVQHEATLHVSIIKKRAGEEPQELRNETVRIQMDDLQKIPNPAYVGVNPHFTRNLGNYESLKVGILVTMPCMPTEEGIADGFEKVQKIAIEQMEKAFKSLL